LRTCRSRPPAEIVSIETQRPEDYKSGPAVTKSRGVDAVLVVSGLPAGFDALAYHHWQIIWGQSHVIFSLDGLPIYSASDHTPQGTMQANSIAWAPGPERRMRTAHRCSL
jgi:hypothetical protein